MRCVLTHEASASQAAKMDEHTLQPEASASHATAAEAQHTAQQAAIAEAAFAQAAAHELEYGRDPRNAPQWITENEELLADLAAKSRPTKALTKSLSPLVASLESLDDFEAAISRADAKGHMIVIKFYSSSCRTCLNMKHLYERAAGACKKATVAGLEHTTPRGYSMALAR